MPAAMQKAQKEAAKEPMPRLEAKVRVYHEIKGKAEVLGFADLVIAGAFVIKDITILMARPEAGQGEPAPFVSFPSRKGTGANQDRWFDVAHPITAEARERAKEAILLAYDEAAAKALS